MALKPARTYGLWQAGRPDTGAWMYFELAFRLEQSGRTPHDQGSGIQRQKHSTWLRDKFDVRHSSVSSVNKMFAIRPAAANQDKSLPDSFLRRATMLIDVLRPLILRTAAIVLTPYGSQA